MTIRELSVCHDWFFVWPSSVEECLNGIGVKRWQFLHAPAEVCIVGGGRGGARPPVGAGRRGRRVGGLSLAGKIDVYYSSQAAADNLL